jgi:murein DD-endopeptidase MepM/ murein hydrolase activator NlpD
MIANPCEGGSSTIRRQHLLGKGIAMKSLLALVTLLGAALIPTASASADGLVDSVTPPATAGTSDAAAASLPLPRSAASRGDYAQPHWNSTPAVDLIVPSGTPVHAMMATTTQHLNTDSCGVGLRLNFGNGDRIIYCHLTSRSVGSGVPVGAGQLVGHSGDTGNSGAPHLHVEIRTGDGAIRCPQPLLLAIYDGAAPPSLRSLPTSGCTGG